MGQSYDFASFKTDIDLVQYAAHMGYEIDKKKSSGSSKTMRSNADKVVISKRNSKWMYWSVFDDNDNGTIIDFIQNRTNKTIGEIGKELHIWLGGAAPQVVIKNYASPLKERAYDPERIKRLFRYRKPTTKNTYLESRGITEALLSSARFIGRIWTDKYHNAVFPHYKDGKISAFEMKNQERGIFPFGSEKTLWRSNIKKTDDTLIISEAAIDSLSYHQIFNPQNAAHVCTCGGLSPEQGVLIVKILEGLDGSLTIKEARIIVDNDKGGDYLFERLKTIIEESSFGGEIARHSPELRGDDWNNVLNHNIKGEDHV